MCYFKVHALAAGFVERPAVEFCHEGVEGLRVLDALLLGFVEGVDEGAQGEGLRGLCSPELFARNHARSLCGVAGEECLLALQGGDGAAVAFADGDGIGDNGRGDQGTHAVVDEDDGVRGGTAIDGGEVADAVADGGKAAVAGGDGAAELTEGQLRGGTAHEVRPFVAADDIDGIDEGVAVEGAHGVGQNGDALDLDVLLGHALCGADAIASGQQ